MVNFLEFALLGLATGAIYALIALGAVLVYRGSGLLNLAQGAFAMVGAYSYYSLHSQAGVPAIVSLILAIALCAVGGWLMYLLILRPMHQSSSLSRVVATLGVVVVLQSAAYLIYGQYPKQMESLIPKHTVFLMSENRLAIGTDSLVIIGIALALTAILTYVYRYTRVGRVTSAVAENGLVASSLGHSPDTVAVLNWSLGSAVAGLAGILVAPAISLEPAGLVMLVIPALSAALVGGFKSFPITLVAALGLGVAQSEITNYVSTPGWQSAAPFIVVTLILVVRGKGLPLRSYVLDRLPRVGTGRILTIPVLIAYGIVLALILNSGPDWTLAFTYTIALGIICLSVVVITGYGGQLSLGQFALAGLAALIGAKLSLHMPFLLMLVLTVLITAVIGAILGLPALRTRGATLAIVTLGLGSAIVHLFLLNSDYTGGPGGITVPVPHLFNWSIDPFFNDRRYASFVLTVAVLVMIGVANLRRGAIGRQLLATRSNERGAAALAINVAGSKLYAFTLGSAIAAVGGVLLAFSQSTITFASFTEFESIYLVAVTVTAGVAYVAGAPFGALLIAGGVVSQLLNGWSSVNLYLPLIGGLAVLITLLAAPDGQVGLFAKALTPLADRYAAFTHIVSAKLPWTHSGAPEEEIDRQPVHEDQPRSVLTVQDLTVRFGGVLAVNGVSLEVRPGEIHGLIGPNGSGKTTCIDAITGFVHSEGQVALGDRNLTGKSPRRRAASGLSRSFQSLELFGDLTVEENLAVAAESPRLWQYITDLFRPGKIRLSAHALAAMHQFELEDSRHLLPEEVSFGQRKAIAIARAVAGRPDVLLLDEPAAGLGDGEANELADLIVRVSREWGIGVLLVEHKMDLVLAISDRLTVLQEGAILTTGEPNAVLSDPRVITAYLGTDAEGADPSQLVDHSNGKKS
ncbi:ABC transporter [Williamsia sp. 1138]|uniref:branched-chain amino acid ABC transporter permease/ATP-binding protein n=1 Tax=Williamsia sp. 1138 TaxID=1903117 RepID=UPI000A10E436|nr:branched-chain amino acid ABC transporter permease/ATP-binding protein [Williamsia sp. 1138]OZG26152.1 ABC transporter [Williamsia sp. 1138]